MSGLQEQSEDRLYPAREPCASDTGRSLLPAFEPMSSSPNPPRASKRKHNGSSRDDRSNSMHYPTPVPTSSTAAAPSSPHQTAALTRPALQRTASTMSERVPLGTLPSVNLPLDGEPVLMGRSSNSSHFQLSNCRLISRVHVSVAYRVPTEPYECGQVVIECLGWNGAKVHCQGKAHQLGKGDTFSSGKPWADIILDVQDARVLVRWPDVARRDPQGASASESEASPQINASIANENIASSPPQLHAFLHSPISPSPRDRAPFTASTTFLGLPSASSPLGPSVEVYEDNPSEPEAAPAPAESASHEFPTTGSKRKSQDSSFLSETHDFSDHDEENDPIIHSFGPFGDNLLPRLESINASTPERQRKPLHASVSPRQPAGSEFTRKANLSPVKNHVINQLAFSRLHSLPLSTIMNNLPNSLKNAEPGSLDGSKQLTPEDLKSLLDQTACIGEIARNGKDAAGKPLEDEFYYVPEMDADEMRRAAVQNSLGKSGLRAVRKQHKQYYWKRPRH